MSVIEGSTVIYLIGDVACSVGKVYKKKLVTNHIIIGNLLTF